MEAQSGVTFGASQQVATPGDLTGDGVADVVRVTKTNRITIIDGATQKVLVSDYQPYEDGYVGGLSLATGDLDGDGHDDIAVCAQAGGSARVIVLRPNLTGAAPTLEVVTTFIGIADENFRGGGHVAIGNYTGSGVQLVVSAGQGGGPRVMVYDAQSLRGVAPIVVDNFFAFEDTTSRDGIDVRFVKNAAGRDVLVAGAIVGGAPRVVGFEATMDAQNQPQRRVVLNDYLGDPNSRAGVNLSAVKDDLTVMLGAAVK